MILIYLTILTGYHDHWWAEMRLRLRSCPIVDTKSNCTTHIISRIILSGLICYLGIFVTWNIYSNLPPALKNHPVSNKPNQHVYTFPIDDNEHAYSRSSYVNKAILGYKRVSWNLRNSWKFTLVHELELKNASLDSKHKTQCTNMVIFWIDKNYNRSIMSVRRLLLRHNCNRGVRATYDDWMIRITFHKFCLWLLQICIHKRR